MHDQAQASAELQQLADTLTRQGYHAAVITPAPYLAIHIPGATLPHMIYNTGGRFWWHTAQDIAPTRQITLAAEAITWGLRTCIQDPAAHDTTAPLATGTPAHDPTSARTSRGGGQQC